MKKRNRNINTRSIPLTDVIRNIHYPIESSGPNSSSSSLSSPNPSRRMPNRPPCSLRFCLCCSSSKPLRRSAFVRRRLYPSPHPLDPHNELINPGDPASRTTLLPADVPSHVKRTLDGTSLLCRFSPHHVDSSLCPNQDLFNIVQDGVIFNSTCSPDESIATYSWYTSTFAPYLTTSPGNI